MITRFVLFLCFSSLVAFVGCGKLGQPLPPELFTPRDVVELTATPAVSAVEFKWKAPELDVRGRELKSLNGYRVYRKEIEIPSDVVDADVEWKLIETVEDKHLEALEAAREKARAEGKPTRRVKIPDELKEFAFVDHSVQPGRTYVYKIVPFNQGDVETERVRLIRVLFRGQSSEINIIEDPGMVEDLL